MSLYNQEENKKQRSKRMALLVANMEKEKEQEWIKLADNAVTAAAAISINLTCPHCNDYQDRFGELRDKLPTASLSVHNIEIVLKCNTCKKKILITSIDY